MAAFGADLRLAFLENTRRVRHNLEIGFLPWDKMPSAFCFLRLLGVPQSLAYAAQIATALAAAAVTVHVWRRGGPTRLAAAVLVTATLLLLPYLFDYELTLLAIPLAILADDMIRNGSGPAERRTLLLAYVTPFLMTGIAQATALQIGFPALIALLTIAARRAFAAAEAGPVGGGGQHLFRVAAKSSA
jgi:hypothetical protein